MERLHLGHSLHVFLSVLMASLFTVHGWKVIWMVKLYSRCYTNSTNMNKSSSRYWLFHIFFCYPLIWLYQHQHVDLDLLNKTCSCFMSCLQSLVSVDILTHLLSLVISGYHLLSCLRVSLSMWLSGLPVSCVRWVLCPLSVMSLCLFTILFW